MANQRIVAHLECVLVWRWPVALSTKMVVERGEERGERGDEFRMNTTYLHPSGNLDSMYHPSAIIQIPEWGA